MPKDGRSHHPHTLLSYMHKHGETLEAEIRELKDKGKLNRDNSPCIMVTIYQNNLELQKKVQPSSWQLFCVLRQEWKTMNMS